MSMLRIFQALRPVAALLCAAFAVAPTGAAVAREPATKPAVCADFLAQMQKKPAHLIFDQCSSAPERQGKPLRATYHVSGVHAARVEAALVKSFGLTKLKRSCCQWDSPAVSFKSVRGVDFLISMVSQETLLAKRSQWRDIPRFEIMIEMLTEEI